MADLKALFSKKATPDANANAGSDSSPTESKPVAGAAPVAASPTQKPANMFASRGGGGQSNPGRQPAGGATASSDDASSGGEPKSRLSTLSISAGSSDSGSDPGSVVAPPIDSLDALNATEDAGTAPRGPSVTYFADETPADKPTRDLPPDITPESLGFLSMLDSVYEILHDPDLLGGVIRNIMVELKSNAEYVKLIAPEDVRVMVRGMRESMGLAKVKKMETKTKRAAGKKSKAADIDMLGDIDAIIGGIDV